jgi:CRISPR/Cas system-associated exonuclease Cas4 (RecB family)
MNATSYSDINTYQRCPKKGYYRTVLNLEPKALNINLFNGINGHAMLRDFFLGLQAGESNTEAWARVLATAEELYQEAKGYMFEDELTDAYKEIDSMLQIVGRYVDKYTEDWEVLHVEEQFITKLESGKVISFTPDLVVKDRNGDVWIIDHKTTSRMPDGGLPFGDTQALMYYTGVKSLYPETKGFIFNRIRKKIPTQPRLAKTGKVRVAYLETLDTTFEILRDFLQENAPALLSDPAHQRRLAALRDQDERWFWTEQIYVTEATEQAILDDIEAVLISMDTSMDTGRWPRALQENHSYYSCSKCPFQRLCQGELVGWDTEQIIEESYQQRGEKNPYEGEQDAE